MCILYNNLIEYGMGEECLDEVVFDENSCAKFVRVNEEVVVEPAEGNTHEDIAREHFPWILHKVEHTSYLTDEAKTGNALDMGILLRRSGSMVIIMERSSGFRWPAIEDTRGALRETTMELLRRKYPGTTFVLGGGI